MAPETPVKQTEQNALSQASSAYLRSAMHQPIRWREWGEEAFAAARSENKPILLDIGAVWCHWCHVMDRESYESPQIAEIINQNFVAIKVDRDERPDIDSRYQAAVSTMTGQGGWPLTAFLTPEGKPFFGGTYFPPDERYGRPSFRRILLALAQAYAEKHSEVQESAESLMKAISHAESFAGRGASFSPGIIGRIVDSAAKHFDVQHGGFGSAPKFPHPAVVTLLLDRYARKPEDYLRTILTTTLEKMANGGVYDQLAGGFHRYSVDESWTVPHFEKMSYDNSELLRNYVQGYQATGNELFAEVARDILRWMEEWLSDRERGGFYASQDADINLDDDGDYFTWTVGEAAAALTEDEFKVAALHYDIGEVGEMHHDPAKNVLFVRAPVEEIANRLGMPEKRASELLASARQRMYAARLKRATPYIDKTIYVNWNALCISASLEAARVLDLGAVRAFALRSLDRILREAWDGKRLKHVVAYSEAAATARDVPGLLDDYAYMTLACLDAYESTAQLEYFSVACELGEVLALRFFDATSGGFFDTESTEGPALGALAARRKPFQDSPTPAGNPAAAIAMLRLFAYTHEADFREMAEETLEVFAGLAGEYGMFAGTYGIAAVMFTEPHTQIVVVGEDDAAAALYRKAVEGFALGKSVLRIPRETIAAGDLPPSLAATLPSLPALKEKRSFAVVCSNFACQPPVFEPAALERALKTQAR